MEMLKEFLRKTRRKITYQQKKTIVQSISTYKDEEIAKFSNLLYESIYNKADKIEKEWIAKIEKIRKEMSSSKEKIQFKDFGAGVEDENQSNDILFQGVVSEKTVGELCRASKSYFWSFILFKLIRTYNPVTCLELGTNLGISGSYLGSALKINQRGSLITLEGSEPSANIAMQNFKRLNLSNVKVVIGRFCDTLESVLNQIKSIDFAFIDGHHDETATISYYKKIVPYVTNGGIIVFDDIYWSEGMQNAWNIIKKNQKISCSIDLYRVGICFINTRYKDRKNFRIPLP